jgi:hypothetical protein
VLVEKRGIATVLASDIHVIDTNSSHPYITVYESKAVQIVTKQAHSKSVRSHNTAVRALSFLLLAFIFYGTTVEVAHKHGSLVGQVEVSGAPSASEPGSEPASNSNVSGCNDCLICQLHQHFSVTLTSGPPNIDQSVSNSFFSSLALVSAGSRTTAPTTGRAPPQAS